ncbi:MAG TPA: zinc ABC transporter substrate-binding protein [Ktedonobacteraceae bacterium]|nr:zinc ABC transporter substrate-binding protein [Ktedonobacteraceae bacterium]
MPPRRNISLWFLLMLAVLLLLSACGSSPQPGTGNTSAIAVVAAENFYGDIVQQIGGDRVSVTSILTDPTVDPHEYESNVQNAVAVSNARFVIKNGGGYDGWMDRLLAASPNTDRMVLTAYDAAPIKLPDNVHVWYSLEDIRAIARTIATSLKKLDSAHAAVFDHNLQQFEQALMPVQQRIDAIRGRYAGTAVGLTETIFLYQANPLGLKVLTPFEFQKAVAEGNDPPASSIIEASDQVAQRMIKVLIYNVQTNTPVTTNLLNAAKRQHIPTVAVTETMPSARTYQQWMLDQLVSLEQGLQQQP